MPQLLTRVRHVRPLLMAIAIAILAAAIPARADIQFFTGIEGGSGDVTNVLFNDPVDISGASTVTGNLQNTGIYVDFTGTELLIAGGGQASIQAFDGGLNSLLISLTVPPGGTFTKAIFNLNASIDGSVTITATEGAAPPQTATSSFFVDSNGSNFFTTVAINGQDIRSILIQTTVDLSEVTQVRLGGIIPGVPEPASMLLVGLGVLGAVLSQRKRWSKRQA